MPVYTYVNESAKSSSDAALLAEAAVQNVINESLGGAVKKFRDEVTPELADAAKTAKKNIKNTASKVATKARSSAEDAGEYINNVLIPQVKEKKQRADDYLKNKKIANDMKASIAKDQKMLNNLENKAKKFGMGELTGNEKKELKRLREIRKAGGLN